MNNVVLMGRLTRDPVITYPQNDGGMAIARYTLAVDRKKRANAKEGEQTADFISCVCFGKTAEFVANYLHQGIKVAVTGRIQTGSYTNKDGQKVYTTDVIVDTHEFAEPRNSQTGNSGQPQNQGYVPQPQQGGYQQPPQNQGYTQQQIPQGGYQQPQQNQGYQSPQGYPQNQGYAPQQQPPQNQGYAPQQNLTPPDDFGFGGFDETIPFN